MNGLEAAVQMPAVNNFGQRADNVRLKPKIHGQVRLCPVSEYTHPHEICLLGFNLLACIVAALLPELGCRYLVARLAHFLFDIEFNGQAVTVPTGDIGGIKTRQGLGLDDDVFEYLVDGMPDVELTIGVGRAVMQDKGRLALRCLAHLAIQVHLSPRLETLGLALRQIRLHREIRLGEIQRGFVVTHTSSVVCKPCPGIGFVRRDAFLQGIERRKFLFVAQLVSKPHCQPLPI